MVVRILDCTLRDGANVVGLGFDAALTKLMIEGLLEAGIDLIEFGNAHGMGMNEPGSPLTDEEYLDLMQPYKGKAEFGMFLQSKAASRDVMQLAAAKGLSFLRVGNDAGDGAKSVPAVQMVKEAGLICRYSQMKAYLLTPAELADEAVLLERAGVDEITVMDSAGTMTSDEVNEYIRVMKKAVSIPIGFHGHNNMGFSIANACAALEGGADVVDSGLLGMARSAGNTPTEVLIAVLKRRNLRCDLNLLKLLEFIDVKLAPVMQNYGYHNAIPPLDLIFGLTGCHSNFSKMFAQVAEDEQVPLYQLIVEVSKIERKAPSKDMLVKVARIIANH